MDATRRFRLSAWLVGFVGLVVLGYGAFFLLGPHPFTGPGGTSHDFDVSQAQVEATSPSLAHYMLHVSDQYGAALLGWGAFTVALAATGLRVGNKASWLALWAGGLPLIVIGGAGELMAAHGEHFGPQMVVVVYGLWFAGMLLPAGRFLAQGRPEALPGSQHA